MYIHVAVLFTPRETLDGTSSKADVLTDTLGTLHTHIDLCRKTMSMLLNSIEENGERFSEETWLTVLKVSLGICDTLLETPRYVRVKDTNKNGNDELDAHERCDLLKHSASIIGDNLCEILIHVIKSDVDSL